MITGDMLKITEELRMRIKHVEAATGEGYGEKHSLRNLLGFAGRLLDDRAAAVLEIERNLSPEEIKAEPSYSEILNEYHDLASAVGEGWAVVDNPDISGVVF